ncbi:arsenate reductase ArsC [Campylobacter sp. MG1]|uniref:arsenate reductase ArsC n=1 Tax=Campylobacter sp. MG1 TaxID=2976332 RepID=UPI00226CFFE7|nr:arsenate reductase ArsC [Campylobacter sp. MG1]
MKVAFICVHNSCRSQIAEALAKSKRLNNIEFYSAGTSLKPINPKAIRYLKSEFNIDISKEKSKLIDSLADIDYVITMGCNVECPSLKHNIARYDFGIADPSDYSKKDFIKTIYEIDKKIDEFLKNIGVLDEK